MNKFSSRRFLFKSIANKLTNDSNTKRQQPKAYSLLLGCRQYTRFEKMDGTPKQKRGKKTNSSSVNKKSEFAVEDNLVDAILFAVIDTGYFFSCTSYWLFCQLHFILVILSAALNTGYFVSCTSYWLFYQLHWIVVILSAALDCVFFCQLHFILVI